eukprot:CAMPEP_0202361440 /NCGR_PEP_ID=MMETSP1126-20121109/14002_1 /ASSEMBLY_ACC=CAM_ASM_000457 /TAXON_ID=3047 /ORGANISM="Dunaliella tertiolecta, Strain CCMP1320" /LENGTH=78 /DNA_ID=CAMNT_0048955393 /DNA_START=26 /DNA_END=258 /DNA_ORIENTATION=+
MASCICMWQNQCIQPANKVATWERILGPQCSSTAQLLGPARCSLPCTRRMERRCRAAAAWMRADAGDLLSPHGHACPS